MLFRAHMSEKVKKIGWILESSGNFLSNEHKTVLIWLKNCWETWIQRYLLPAKRTKKLKFEQLHTNYSFAFRTAWILKSHLKNSQAYFIKWTTSGEPPVGLKSLQDSKWSHSEVILYIAHWLPPCTYSYSWRRINFM